MSRLAFLRLQRGVPAAIVPLAALLLVTSGIDGARAAVPSWPVSSGLVIGEVVTGGASASDEYVEIYNASDGAVSLAGLEVVYVTSSGGTVTRKASWIDGTIGARGHVLVANSSGVYGALADVTYSGGFAATGGALVLRPIGGAPFDALAWGDATNGFVEGTPAPAPAEGSSVERLPGGLAGNWLDTNDNAADTRLEPAPVGQGALAPATPDVAPTPSVPATAAPFPTETAAATATSSATATPTPTTTPPASGTPQPSPSPTPTAVPEPTPISVARRLAVGSAAFVTGIVTAQAGTLVDARTIAIQDETGGTAVRLVAGSEHIAVRGDRVTVRGTTSDPYGNLTLRVARATDLAVVGRAAVPGPTTVASVAEAVEGRLVRIEGVVAEVDRTAASTLGVVLEGGTRATAFRSRHTSLDTLRRGQRIRVSGVAAQRRTTTHAGYRVWLRDPADLMILSPAPAGPTPKPSASPARPTAPSPVAVASAKGSSRIGAVVAIVGVVTTRRGLLDSDARRVVVQDASGAILVRLPASGSKPGVGDRIAVVGKVGTYYGARQLAASAVTARGPGTVPAPVNVGSAPIAERLEWQLVRARGTIRSLSRRGRSWKLDLVLPGGSIPVVGEERVAIPAERLSNGARLTITGLARRPRSTATDRRFAISPRTVGDVLVDARPGAASATASPSAGGTHSPHRSSTGSGGRAVASGAVVDVDLRSLPKYAGRTVRVGGELVGRDGTAITLRDATGVGSVRLPKGSGPHLADIGRGEPLNVTGVVRRAGGRWEVVARSPSDVDRIAILAPPGAAPASPDAGGSAPVSTAVAVPARPILSTSSVLPPALIGLLAVSLALAGFGVYLRWRAGSTAPPEDRRVPPNGV